MTQTDHLAQDLQFVKAAIERSDKTDRTPIAIPILWAGITLGGCLFIDLDPRHCWIYWMFAPVLGYIASAMIGGRAMFQMGEMDREMGMRQGLHWSSCFFGTLPIVLLAATGKIDGWRMGQLMFLVSGLVYYMAGVHFDRRYMLPGIAMILSSALLCLMFPFAWTACGLFIAVSLVASFLLIRPRPSDARNAGN